MSVRYSGGEIEELLARADLISYLKDDLGIKLEKSGMGYMACCPLHEEDLPSFHVSKRGGKWLWHCFGACETGGDIIALYRAKNHCEFPEALESLAERYGVTLSPRHQQERESINQKRAVLLEAQKYFLRELGGCGPASMALEDRGISLDTAKAWGIGYTGYNSEGLYNYLISKGFTPKEIVNQGLARRSERFGTAKEPSYYDFFRLRLTIPLYDTRGHLTGFTGRDLTGDARAKYMNSPEGSEFGSTLFKREEVLFGLSTALKAIDKNKFAFITEGNFDVVSGQKKGLENLVAPMGTSSFSPYHVSFLARWCNRLVFVFDNDEAGIKAALRAAKITYEGGLDPEFVMLPKPSGRKKIDLDEFLRDCDKEGLNALEEFNRLPRLDVVKYFVETHQDKLDLSSPSGKFRALDQLVECFRGENNYSRKIIWINYAAQTLQIDPRAVEERYLEKLDHKRLDHIKLTVPRDVTEVAWCYLVNLLVLPPQEAKVAAHGIPTNSNILEPEQQQLYQLILARSDDHQAQQLVLGINSLEKKNPDDTSQTVLSYLSRLHQENKIPHLPYRLVRMIRSGSLSPELSHCKEILSSYMRVEEQDLILRQMMLTTDEAKSRELSVRLDRLMI